MRHTAAPPAAALVQLAGLLSDDADPEAGGRAPDWQSIVALATRHGLAPVLLRRLQRREPRGIPTGVLNELRTAFIAAAYASHRVGADTETALDVLARAGVRVMVLKGLHLAACYYDDAALRPMVDIDLLVRAEDAPRAWTALSSIGYAPSHQGSRYQATRAPHHHLPRLYRPGATPIELHLGLALPNRLYRIDVGTLWDRESPVQIRSRRTAALYPEDLLLHLCLHTADQHRCIVPLRNVYDIAQVVNRADPPIRWADLLSTAEAWGARRPLCCGLVLASGILGARVPGPVLQELASSGDRQEILRRGLDAIACFGEAGAAWLRVLAAKGTVLQKARGMLAHAFPRRPIPDAHLPRPSLASLRSDVRTAFAVLQRHGRLLAYLALPGTAHSQLRAARAEAAVEAWIRDTAPGPPPDRRMEQ